MISQTAEYALRAIVCLADCGQPAMTTQEIASVTQVPSGYLSKVLSALGRAGLVQAQRGLHGGFSLSRPPAELTVLDVVNAVDPIRRIHSCPLGLASHGVNLCPLHRRLDDATAMIEQTFSVSKVSDLLSQEGGIVPLREQRSVPPEADYPPRPGCCHAYTADEQ